MSGRRTDRSVEVAWSNGRWVLAQHCLATMRKRFGELRDRSPSSDVWTALEGRRGRWERMGHWIFETLRTTPTDDEGAQTLLMSRRDIQWLLEAVEGMLSLARAGDEVPDDIRKLYVKAHQEIVGLQAELGRLWSESLLRRAAYVPVSPVSEDGLGRPNRVSA